MSDAYGAQRWVSFYNDSGETIPSYALLMFVSDSGEPDTTVNFSKRLRAKQYTTDGDKRVYAFNSRSPVKAGEYGKCNFAVDGPAWARIKDVDVPAVNLDEDAEWIEREYGPVDSKWSIGPDGTGYRLLTRPQKLTDTDYHRVLVMAERPTAARLVVNGTTDRIAGPRDGAGTYEQVLCYLVDDTLIGTHSNDPEDRILVDFQSLNAIVLPHHEPETSQTVSPVYCCWAIPAHAGRWKAISGGLNYFEGVVETVVGDPSEPCSNIVAVTPVLNQLSDPDEYMPSLIVSVFCCDVLMEGARVGVQVMGSQYRVVSVCCMD